MLNLIFINCETGFFFFQDNIPGFLLKFVSPENNSQIFSRRILRHLSNFNFSRIINAFFIFFNVRVICLGRELIWHRRRIHHIFLTISFPTQNKRSRKLKSFFFFFAFVLLFFFRKDACLRLSQIILKYKIRLSARPAFKGSLSSKVGHGYENVT